MLSEQNEHAYDLYNFVVSSVLFSVIYWKIQMQTKIMVITKVILFSFRPTFISFRISCLSVLIREYVVNKVNIPTTVTTMISFLPKGPLVSLFLNIPEIVAAIIPDNMRAPHTKFNVHANLDFIKKPITRSKKTARINNRSAWLII